MSKEELIRQEMYKAMKNKMTERKAILSLILSNLHKESIDKTRLLSEDEENAVILKEMKQIEETLSLTPPDRKDIIEQCEYRLSVLNEFAPKMLGENAIDKIIDETLSELNIVQPTKKDKGSIMKNLMPKVKGKADGKLVSDLVNARLEW